MILITLGSIACAFFADVIGLVNVREKVLCMWFMIMRRGDVR